MSYGRPPQATGGRLARVALRISLATAAVEVIAIFVLLANVIFNSAPGHSGEQGMAMGIGFMAAMLPSLFVGSLAAGFARGWRIEMFGLQFILAAAGLMALMWAGV